MVKLDLKDYIDRNPAFESEKDVREYLEYYDRMKNYSPLVLNTELVDSSIGEVKVKCEKYLINSRKLLEKYGQYIDYSRVDYTYDQLLEMQREALNRLQEQSKEDLDSLVSILSLDAFDRFHQAMITCLMKSGLSAVGWEMDVLSDKDIADRHSYCEKSDGEGLQGGDA